MSWRKGAIIYLPPPTTNHQPPTTSTTTARVALSGLTVGRAHQRELHEKASVPETLMIFTGQSIPTNQLTAGLGIPSPK